MTAPFKTFALRLSGFLLLPLLVVVAAEAWVRAQPNAARYKHAWLADSAASVGTLVLGSSHTYYGICPETLADDAFSLALPSQTLRYDLALLRRYPLPRLHTLVVPLSYFTLHEDLETTSREPHTAARYRIYIWTWTSTQRGRATASKPLGPLRFAKSCAGPCAASA